MLGKYIDTSEFSGIHYLGLIFIVLLIFTILFKDSVPKLDLGEMFNLKKFQEGYKNMTYPNASPDDFSKTVADSWEGMAGELDYDVETNGKKNVKHYAKTMEDFDMWTSMVVIKALVQGAIDPKETDITKPSFDKNMKVIEKVNKIMEFQKHLEELKKIE